jgi:hypothetical protein
VTYNCGSPAGIAYMLTYYIVVPLIFLNLFIAIILEGFETTSKKENTVLQQEDFKKFVSTWSLFDKEGRGFIKLMDI